ncbi:hypothetical protein [Edaphobacter aggregans]|uniref:hypothetical protein n=1 Tax=Edaphobacter aggregans TaxID=570835 RepID=UPI00146FE974|nr:hypothetical protein [Edaphobacter aggregans]
MRMEPIGFLTFACIVAFTAATAAAQTRQISSSGTGSFSESSLGVDIGSGPELDSALSAVEHDNGNDATGAVHINRRIDNHPKGPGVNMSGKSHSKSNPVVNLSVDGLSFFQQRFADGGNQFSVEPPDQGLCAGNGFVLESTNDVLRVFDSSGNIVRGVVSLNQFYGYPHAIDRTTGAFGPQITDPSCYFDQDTQRWFHLALTLDRTGTTSALSGKNHLDLAVSQSADPLGTWTIYRIPAQDDGTDGTPNHHCPGGACLGDYPHIGADGNGIYLTTNEFPLFAGGFIGAQIYAISKQAIASNGASITVVQYNTGDPSTNTASGLPGFTVWPAISAGPSPSEFGGTEYFLSSLAVFQDSGVDNRLQLWSLTNTKALSRGGAPTLTSSIVNTQAYAIPDFARQPGVGTNGVGMAPGGGNIDFPLGQCFNLPACSNLLIGVADPFTEVISPLAANDSRMGQVYYANGRLWSALGTGITFDGVTYGSSGLAYFVLHPKADGGTPVATVDNQGYLADPNLDVTYGTVAVTQSGRGVLSFTATGPANYPSVGFASLDALAGAGDIQIAAAGVGAQDGFTGYRVEGFGTRWGDYGAAAVDGNSIWFGQEYIGQTCTLSQYISSSPLGTCGNTRAALGNWGTRIVKVTP